jgi:hypothetical protein
MPLVTTDCGHPAINSAKNLAHILFATGCLLLLSLLMASSAQGQTSKESDKPDMPFVANEAPLLDIPFVDSPVRLDGLLDEALWQSAAIASNFSESNPTERGIPDIGMKALMAYDTEYLYVAYIIKDNPEEIRARLSDRDQIWQDDYAGMLLDTNGDGQVTYFISANPLGIQGDTRSAGDNEDESFDLIYSSAGTLTDSGYQIEMAIPFRSLRFPEADIQEWRATFWITRPREDRFTYSWAGIDRDDPCFTCQFGTLRGMSNIERGRNLEILPAITGSQAGSRNPADPGSGFDNGRMTAEPSFNLKYGLTSDLTLDATINPDFSQIESDAAQIDVNSTFALSYPERRAFFQEGGDLFQTNIDAVYTRSINDPIAASKLSGRFGNWTVGYIGARDNTSPILMPFEEGSALVSGGKSVSNIFRARRSFENSSFVAAMVTDRRMDDGGSGSVVGVDGGIWFLQNYLVSWQVLASHTQELNDASLSTASGLDGRTFSRGDHTAALDGESFSGHGIALGLGRGGREWGFDINYNQLSPTFRTDNGFVTMNDNRRFDAQYRYSFWFTEHPVFNRINVFSGVNRFWNYDNVRKDEAIFGGFNLQMKRQTFININAFTSNELFAGVKFNGIQRVNVFINSNFSQKVQAGFRLNAGDGVYRNPDEPALGGQVNAGADLTIVPTDRMVISNGLNYSRLRNRSTGDNYFSGYILRSQLRYQFTRKLKTRVIVQYNDFAERMEVDPLVTYRISPFTVFHIGSTHRFQDFPGHLDQQSMVFQQTERQIFFKFQYLFRM